MLCVYCHVTNFSLSRFGYWISGKGTISHSSSVVAYLIAHSRILILSLLRMACLRSAESVREFVSAVTSTEAAAGIYTLIRNSVDIDYYTNQCRSQCACFALARTACWLCQQDSYSKITNIEIHRVRSHFIGAPCEDWCPCPEDWCPCTSLVPRVIPCSATSLVPRVRLPLHWCPAWVISATSFGAPCKAQKNIQTENKKKKNPKVAAKS